MDWLREGFLAGHRLSDSDLGYFAPRPDAQCERPIFRGLLSDYVNGIPIAKRREGHVVRRAAIRRERHDASVELDSAAPRSSLRGGFEIDGYRSLLRNSSGSAASVFASLPITLMLTK
jgi:hypothetical protein